MSLLIGSHIYRVLSEDEELENAFGRSIYPIVIPVGAPQYPFLVYTPVEVAPDDTKDGTCEDEARVVLTIVAKGYDDLVELANRVRYLLVEAEEADYAQYTVNSCTFLRGSEGYIEELDAFVIELEMVFKTIDK